MKFIKLFFLSLFVFKSGEANFVNNKLEEKIFVNNILETNDKHLSNSKLKRISRVNKIFAIPCNSILLAYIFFEGDKKFKLLKKEIYKHIKSLGQIEC